MTAVIKAKVERARRIGLLPMFMAALVVAVMGSAVYLTVANAVHKEGIFQLDGDARTSDVQLPNGTTPNPVGAEDWDKICKADPDCDLLAGYPDPGGTTSEDFQFVTELPLDNILTGGGTKDDLDIPSWKWKTASPSPDKNDLQHAFAAKYSTATEKFIYFGADRVSNNGNANIAFWFFQGQVGAPGEGGATDFTCEAGSGCPFTGSHVAHDTKGTATLADDTPGDILVVSAFTGGGTQPNIAVYEWWGAGNVTPVEDCANNACSLKIIIPPTGSLSAPCATTTNDNDPACAIVNGVDCEGPEPTGKTKAGECTTGSPGTDSPWAFQDKGGLAENHFDDGEFFEGGLNLTALGFAEVCISSFLVNTRSSQSVDSVLHDFALGDLGGCTASVATTPKDGAATPGNVPGGGFSLPTTGILEVRDSATVTVTGISTWSGNVQFYLCGPVTSPATCETGGVAIGSPVPVSNATPTVLSPDNSAYVTEANSATNQYCWRAVFISTTPPDLAPSPGVADFSQTECFVVNPVQPTLDTDAGDGPVSLGQAITDTATLTGTAKQPDTTGTPYPSINTTNATNGALAGGTITFQLYGPVPLATSPCPTTINAAFATAHPTGIQRTVNGDGTYGNNDGVPAAPATDGIVSFTPTEAGFYWWKAEYSGNLPNTKSASHNATCTDTDQRVEVLQLQPTITTAQNWLPNDSATVSVTSEDGALAGSVLFELFTNGAGCVAATGQPAYFVTRDITTDGTGTDFVRTVSTANTTLLVSASATVSWKVTYTNTNPAHKNIAASCFEQTQLIINNNTDSLHPAP